VGLAIDLLEDIQPLGLVGDDAAEARLHQRVPDGGVVLVGEALRLCDGPGDDPFELRVALLVCEGGTGSDKNRYG
jgi:hypothetical protein